MKITIVDEDKKEQYEVVENETILQVFQQYGFTQVHSPCGGNGTCKKCQVEVKGKGMVLSCQTKVEDYMKVYITKEAESFIAENGNCYLYESDGEEGYGVACDIGTTTVVCHLLNRKTGTRLQTASGPNAERSFGADVIARIEASCNGKLAQMNHAIIEQLNSFLENLCEKETRRTGKKVSSSDIKYMAVVGNTVMLHLFSNLAPDTIGVAPFTPKSLFGTEENAKHLGLKIDGNVYLAPCVAGYVGGDITSDMLAIEMEKSEEKILLLDIGTNGEMTLGDKNGCICCSTAAGPAFEGAQIKMGMPAAKGAISKVTVTGEGEKTIISVEIIGDQTSVGICGSGLIDALAVMIELEVIDETGCFAEKDELPDNLACYLGKNEEGVFFQLDEHVIVTQADIRKLQLAKAAIATGIQVLVNEAGIKLKDISKLILAGGFGSFLNPKSAAKIGLIPEELLAVTISVGNAAGEGAVSLALSKTARTTLQKIQNTSRYIELSTDKRFTSFYMDAMYFDV